MKKGILILLLLAFAFNCKSVPAPIAETVKILDNPQQQDKYQWQEAMANGYTYKYVSNDPMNARFYTLKNGLTVIVSPNDKEPRIAYRMVVGSGSNDDPKEHTGLAHYLEHLLFKGTDKYGSLDWVKEKPLLDEIDELYEQYNSTTDTEKRKEIYKEIDRVSGEAAKFAIAGEYDHLMSALGSQGTNAYTWVEQTVYMEDIPANALDKFLTVQAERFRNPTLRIFHTELEAVYEEKNRSLDSDESKMFDTMLSTMFPTHNYGLQSTIGTIEHLKNPSIKAIREFYNNNYIPNNMALVMSGDFNPDEVIAKVDKAFAYMQPKEVTKYVGSEEAPIEAPLVKEVFGPSAEQIAIAFRSPGADTREAMLADIAISILSNGSAGLFDLNLNMQQKVLGTFAQLLQFKDYGLFLTIGIPTEGQSLEEVKSLILEQISMLKKGDFEESLLKAIVANKKLDLIKGLEKSGNRADALVDAFVKSRGNKWNKNTALLDAMSRVSKEELVAFANILFSDVNYVQLNKRQGEDKGAVKVEKPPITPVETNAGKVSPFVKNITETPLPPFTPVWVDYGKDIQKSKTGIAEVIYVQNTENTLFNLTYNFEMGSWNNKILPAATQYLQFLGTDNSSAEEISEAFYKLACSFDISTEDEQTTIIISGLQENFDEAVKLFEDLLTNCKPNAEALEGLKGLLMKDRTDSKSNKQAISQGIQSYAFYGAKNPFNYTLSNDELTALKATDLTDLLHALTSYEHKITYYGPLPLNTFNENIKALHKIPTSWKSDQESLKFEKIGQTKNEVLFTDYDAVQSEIYWIKNLDKYDPAKEAVIDVFNKYFGGGMGSVVFSTIRESKALAYSTYSFVRVPSKKDDLFSTISYIGCQADKMNDAIVAMNELQNELPETMQGFDNAKSGLRNGIETERIPRSGFIESYLKAQRKGLDYDIRKEKYDQYTAITFSDIEQFHQQQMSNQSYTYCVIGSKKDIDLDDLKKYGEVKKLSLEEIFGY